MTQDPLLLSLFPSADARMLRVSTHLSCPCQLFPEISKAFFGARSLQWNTLLIRLAIVFVEVLSQRLHKKCPFLRSSKPS